MELSCNRSALAVGDSCAYIFWNSSSIAFTVPPLFLLEDWWLLDRAYITAKINSLLRYTLDFKVVHLHRSLSVCPICRFLFHLFKSFFLHFVCVQHHQSDFMHSLRRASVFPYFSLLLQCLILIRSAVSVFLIGLSIMHNANPKTGLVPLWLPSRWRRIDWFIPDTMVTQSMNILSGLNFIQHGRRSVVCVCVREAETVWKPKNNAALYLGPACSVL